MSRIENHMTQTESKIQSDFLTVWKEERVLTQMSPPNATHEISIPCIRL